MSDANNEQALRVLRALWSNEPVIGLEDVANANPKLVEQARAYIAALRNAGVSSPDIRDELGIDVLDESSLEPSDMLKALGVGKLDSQALLTDPTTEQLQRILNLAQKLGGSSQT